MNVFLRAMAVLFLAALLAATMGLPVSAQVESLAPATAGDIAPAAPLNLAPGIEVLQTLPLQMIDLTLPTDLRRVESALPTTGTSASAGRDQGAAARARSESAAPGNMRSTSAVHPGDAASRRSSAALDASLGAHAPAVAEKLPSPTVSPAQLDQVFDQRRPRIGFGDAEVLDAPYGGDGRRRSVGFGSGRFEEEASAAPRKRGPLGFAPQGPPQEEAEGQPEPVILVTGFEPFGDLKSDVSGDIAALLDGHVLEIRQNDAGETSANLAGKGQAAPVQPGRLLASYRVMGRTLPNSFERAALMAEDLVEKVEPALLLMFDLSGRAPHIEIESLAKNIQHSPGFADADGQAPVLDYVLVRGAPGHVSTAPVEALAERLRSMSKPAVVSADAGTFVGNTAFYMALNAAFHLGLDTMTGFIHLPFAQEHLGEDQRKQLPNWPLNDLTAAAAAILISLGATVHSQRRAPPKA